MTILIGDCRDVMPTLPERSVRCCVTSPPYFGLRDYGHEGQIGLESSVQDYVDQLVAVFREVRRILADDGTLFLNLGDSYGQGKQLIGVPWRVAFALQADGWILRQDIIWAKPNPMPESVTDRCTKAHEYLFLFSKQPRYYFNAAAIAEPVAPSTIERLSQPTLANQHGSDRVPGKTNGTMKAVPPRFGGHKYGNDVSEQHRTKSGNPYDLADKRNKRSVWTVATQPYAEAHFAVFPPKLIEPCILAGSQPGDTVLDPFAGSGTTLQVAKHLGRQPLGVELNPAYKPLIEQRLAQNVLMLGV